ncbi:MAG: pyridoxamine kinase [Enterocloster sp.]
MSQYHQKKIAMINDLSGYGRCSLTVALPILSAMKLQCCPVPTAILSNHTGFPVFFFDDYTDKMPSYLEKWRELKLTFDGIITGFLGSEKQIEIVMNMIREFKTPETKVIIDPIMGDHGKTYATYTDAMCSRMKELVSLGDIVTPNLTEACILTGRPYRKEGWSREKLAELAEEIHRLGPEAVVITGISQGSYLVNAVAEKGKDIVLLRRRRVGRERPGTGDVFSSVVAGGAVRGWELKDAVGLAASFVKECIARTEERNIPVQNGVCFEELLGRLMNAVKREE